MKASLFPSLRLLLFGTVVLLGCQVARSAVVIDGFTTYQMVSVSGPPIGFKSAFQSALITEAIGGERDLYVERTSANNGTVEMEVAGSGAGIASYNSGVRTTGNGLIVWDGVDGNQGIAMTGLGGFDLTQSGINTTFRLSRTSDLGGSLKLTVYQDATHISEATVVVAADPSFSFVPVDVTFSSFVAVGANGGANFASVGALSLYLNGGTAGADIGVESFVAVPEASSLLAGAGLLCVVAAGNIRRRATKADPAT